MYKSFNLRVSDAKLHEMMLQNTKKIAYEGNVSNTDASYFLCDKTPVLKYKIFDQYDNLITGFSTKLGGVSKEHLSSLNLSFSRGDKEENVRENHKRFGETLGYDENRLVFSDQQHHTNIKVVSEQDAGRGITDKERYEDVDGLLTNVKNLPLMTFYADCVPVYFYDPVNQVIGMAHSGWRGTVAKISNCMVQKMQQEFQSKPEDIICAIGPSICKACYEVSEDVIVEVNKAFSMEISEKLYDAKDNGKYQLDLHKAVYETLVESGITKEHIALPDYCTCCNSDVFYSHRATNGKRGNLAAVMMLKSN